MTENEASEGLHEILMCKPSEVFFSRYDLRFWGGWWFVVEWLHLSDSPVYKKKRDK